MAEGIRFTKQSNKESTTPTTEADKQLDTSIKDKKQQLIDAVDNIKESPESRALRVYDILKSQQPVLTNWDIICFCSQFLASQIHSLPWLKAPVKHLSQLIYTQHYVMTESDER